MIDEEDQITHTLSLEDPMNPENELSIGFVFFSLVSIFPMQTIALDFLDVFKFDPDFEKNEAMYEEIRKEIIGDGGESSEDESDDDDAEEQSDEEKEKG